MKISSLEPEVPYKRVPYKWTVLYSNLQPGAECLGHKVIAKFSACSCSGHVVPKYKKHCVENTNAFISLIKDQFLNKQTCTLYQV